MAGQGGCVETGEDKQREMVEAGRGREWWLVVKTMVVVREVGRVREAGEDLGGGEVPEHGRSTTELARGEELERVGNIFVIKCCNGLIEN